MLAMKEKKKKLTLLFRIIHVLYILEKHSIIAIIKGLGEVCNFKLGYEDMGHRDKNTRSKKRMYGFVDRFLLGSWTKKKFRKQT